MDLVEPGTNHGYTHPVIPFGCIRSPVTREEGEVYE